MAKPKCVDCGKLLSRYDAKRCSRCSKVDIHNGNYKHGKTNNNKCIDCGKRINLGYLRCKSCSKKGELHYRFIEDRESLKKYCINCGIEITRGSQKGFCQKCYDRRLENNPNWRDGSSFEPYPLGWTNTYKEQIRYRDGYKCQICGMSELENGRKLDVHHIDYDKSNLDPDNLVSACRSCHMKTNYNRKKWEEYFNGHLLLRSS